MGPLITIVYNTFNSLIATLIILLFGRRFMASNELLNFRFLHHLLLPENVDETKDVWDLSTNE